MQADGALGQYLYLRAGGEPWAEHDGIEQVALKAEQGVHGAIIERAGYRRQEILSAGRADLAETAAGDLDGDFQQRRRSIPDDAAIGVRGKPGEFRG
jgi:hypothetical protein